MPRKFQFEELDDRSQRYLREVHARRGEGMPGIYVAGFNGLPVLGLIVGLIIVVVFQVIAWNQIEQEPLAVAMLQTAGLLLGGWMVVAGIRSMAAAGGSRRVGNFVYADAETLWECSGSTVVTTNLNEITEATGVQNFNNHNRYQNTTVTVRTAKARRSFVVASEEGARRLIVFLNMLAWMRNDSEASGAEGGFDFRNLPPAVMGAAAREAAIHGELPRDLSARGLQLEVDDVPSPERERRASFGWINLLIIAGIGIGGVYLFKSLNIGWRDDAIWESIGQIPLRDQRAPWLRMYLADERNTRHRDDARQMLRDIYKEAVQRIRGGFANPGAGFPPAPVPPGPPLVPPGNPIGPVLERVDNELAAGLEVVLMQLAELPFEIASVSVKETDGDPDGAAAREKSVRLEYARALMDGVGKELLVCVEAPEDLPGMIDIRYAYKRRAEAMLRPEWEVTFTFTFRTSPDEEPSRTVTKSEITAEDPSSRIGALAARIGLRTAGPKRPDPLPPPGDF